MEERKNLQVTVIFIVTIACLGLIIESISEHWEFWVSPILAAGIAAMWVMHATQYATDSFREGFVLAFGMAGAFFHGVHDTSFFDVAVIFGLFLITYTILGRKRFLQFILLEYVAVMAIQFYFAIAQGSVEFTPLNISRVILHIVVILCCYYICIKIINNKVELAGKITSKDSDLSELKSDMEDFLSNVSHELRTPVNVVNGMSELILKERESEEVTSIRDAGHRLSRQIEDIQDYNDIKSGEMMVESEKYMITSLINDLLANYRMYAKNDKVEFVIDLDPQVPSMMRGDIRKIHKIIRHLIDNAIKFTRQGGVYIRIIAYKRDYGVNLMIEVTDTGVGMSRKDLAAASTGLYQANKKRNRSTGGIGLGLNIVYGLAHCMNGFVTIDSEPGRGTTVRVSLPQEVIDSKPCLRTDSEMAQTVVFHVRPDKYKVAQVREFYSQMAVHLARGLKLNLYYATSSQEVWAFTQKMKVTHIFMGPEEYQEYPSMYDKLSEEGVVVAVSADEGFTATKGSKVIVMPKPLYGFPVMKILNEGNNVMNLLGDSSDRKPVFNGLKALIVDDEPMNLVVATGLFRDYRIMTDTANSGKEAIDKYINERYDVVFMDHMMPEMDGVECMKILKNVALEKGRFTKFIALTANAISGAKKMFMDEGFDGFIAKPIDTKEFEYVMTNVLPEEMVKYIGGENE